MRGLDNKIAVVVGAARGNIGAATAARLSSEGSTVIVADLDLASAEIVAEEIRVDGGSAFARQVDIGVEESFQELLERTARDLSGVDYLFNVAADLSSETIGTDSVNDVTTLPVDVWNRTIDVNLTGYMLGIRHAMPLMIERGGGVIVNTMSASVWSGDPIRVAYSTAKAGIAALTRHAAAVGGKVGVRCNAVAPGLIMTESAMKTLPENFVKQFLGRIPATRLGKPEDVAAAVAFLFSDDGEWINGQIISIDGGQIQRN